MCLILTGWVHRGYADVGRLLTSVAAASRHGNEYNNNSSGGGVVREDVDGRRLVASGGKPATGEEVDRPLNLEVHKRPDTKLERPDSRSVERDSMSGKELKTHFTSPKSSHVIVANDYLKMAYTKSLVVRSFKSSFKHSF